MIPGLSRIIHTSVSRSETLQTLLRPSVYLLSKLILDGDERTAQRWKADGRDETEEQTEEDARAVLPHMRAAVLETPTSSACVQLEPAPKAC